MKNGGLEEFDTNEKMLRFIYKTLDKYDIMCIYSKYFTLLEQRVENRNSPNVISFTCVPNPLKKTGLERTKSPFWVTDSASSRTYTAKALA